MSWSGLVLTLASVGQDAPKSTGQKVPFQAKKLTGNYWSSDMDLYSILAPTEKVQM